MSALGDQARALIARVKRGNSYRTVFETPVGQQVLFDILGRAGVLEVVTEPQDVNLTCFRDGRRSLALEILQELRWSERELVKLAEHQTHTALTAGDE